MGKHILDRARTRHGEARTLEYLKIDRADRAHNQSISLQRRLDRTFGENRQRRFFEIERGKAR